MTAQSKITGTHVLTAPEHIRGKISHFADPQRKADRIAWLKALPEGTTIAQIADALGIKKSSTLELLRNAGLKRDRLPARKGINDRGIRVGHITNSVIAGLTWQQQDALEAHCARTGQTVAEALVELWATVHAEGKA